MKKKILFIGLLLINFIGFSQVGIGTDNPNIESILEVFSEEKGIILPRLFLESIYDPLPMDTHVQGMIVFNLSETEGLYKGYYYNDGEKWIRFVGNNDETDDGVDISALEALVKELEKKITNNLDPVGVSKLWSGSKANIPEGYLLEDGRSILRTEFQELFDVIGTSYGEGDDLGNTFQLPNSSNRTVMGVGTDIIEYTTGGEKEITLEEDQMPSHNHTIGGTNLGTPSGTVNVVDLSVEWMTASSFEVFIPIRVSTSSFGPRVPSSTTDSQGWASISHGHTATFSGNPLGSHGHGMSNAGSGEGIDITPKYIAKCYIIKAKSLIEEVDIISNPTPE